MNGCKGNKIRHIVRLRQIVRKWRKIASARIKISPRMSTFPSLHVSDDESCTGGRNGTWRSSNSIPPDVPAGHMAVYVGKRCTRFVIKATYLNHPVFGALLDRAEEEYGFNPQGGLTIPCDELLFEHILRLVGRNDPAARHLNLDELQNHFCCNDRNYCSSEALAKGFSNFGKESIPLLRAFAEKSVG